MLANEKTNAAAFFAGALVVLEFITRNIINFGRKIGWDEGFCDGNDVEGFVVYFYGEGYEVLRKMVDVDMGYGK